MADKIRRLIIIEDTEDYGDNFWEILDDSLIIPASVLEEPTDRQLWENRLVYDYYEFNRIRNEAIKKIIQDNRESFRLLEYEGDLVGYPLIILARFPRISID